METENGKDAVVEGIISLWKISPKGQLIKHKQKSFHYDQNFIPTSDQKMKLTLSHDKKIITLGI
jgi:hypothetical protein